MMASTLISSAQKGHFLTPVEEDGLGGGGGGTGDEFFPEETGFSCGGGGGTGSCFERPGAAVAPAAAAGLSATKVSSQ